MNIDISLVIASPSIAIALASFFLNHICLPKIKVQLGSTAELYHSKHKQGFATGFYLPVAFENLSNKNGVINNAGLVCSKISNPNKKYFILYAALNGTAQIIIVNRVKLVLYSCGYLSQNAYMDEFQANGIGMGQVPSFFCLLSQRVKPLISG